MSITNSNTNDVSLEINGIVNLAVTMAAAGDYVVQGQLSLPMARDASDGNGSVVTTTVKLNSTTMLSGVAGATGFRVLVPGVAVGDVIHVITASSAAPDNALNAVKGQVQIFMGDI